MKSFCLSCVLCLMTFMASSQTVVGKWVKSDEQGIETYIVEIYEKEDKVYGKIVNVLANVEKEALCEKCTGEYYQQPIIGLEIIKGLTFDGTYYRNGRILSPEEGKTYKCRLSLEEGNPNVLEVREYMAFIYETQYWRRLKE